MRGWKKGSWSFNAFRQSQDNKSEQDSSKYEPVPTAEDVRHVEPSPRVNKKRLGLAHCPGEEVRKEDVLESILVLDDEDVTWIINSILSIRPSMYSTIENPQRSNEDISGQEVETCEVELPQIGLEESESMARYSSSRVHPSQNTHPKDPVMQFLSPMFFVSEGETNVEVQVMRIGGSDAQSEVSYATRDGSAIEGKHYQAAQGMVIFEPEETLKTISVDLIDDDEWSPNFEFHIDLKAEGSMNVSLDPYLCSTRVLVVEDDPFPSAKYKDQIYEDRLGDVPNIGLVVEYVKMQWRNDDIRCATKKIFFADLLDNLHFLAKALLQMYLVDSVLNLDVPESDLFIMQSRSQTLLAVSIIIVIPHFLIHYLELAKPFGVGSMSRKLLQKSLFDRFLNYSPAVELPDGDLVMAMSRDSLAVVNNIYRGLVHVVGLCGKIMSMMVCQFLAPLIFDQPIHLISIVPLCVFPVLMLVFLKVRDKYSTDVLFERLRLHDSFIEFVSEVVQNQGFIEECNARRVFLDLCESKIDTYHDARKSAKRLMVNNRQFAEWLSTILLAFYTLYGGWSVIYAGHGLGIYVTNLNMFQGLGRVYSELYNFVLSIHEVMPGLKRLTRLLNVPTELHMRKEMAHHRQAQCQALHAETGSNKNTDIPLIDQLPICCRQVCFKYQTNAVAHDYHSYSVLTAINDHDCCQSHRVSVVAGKAHHEGSVNFYGQMKLTQGRVIQFIGPHGEGKTTLLKLIGGVLIPRLNEGILAAGSNPHFFVPPHLSAFYVTSEPTFFRGTLMDNLCIGVKPGSNDGSLLRVSKVCQRFGLHEILPNLLDHHGCDLEQSWLHHLSHTEQALLCLARALIANPELLCIERHWMGFNDQASLRILLLLRDHVDSRGLEQDADLKYVRRPRSCLMTGADKLTIQKVAGHELIDSIYRITAAKGIELVHERQIDGERHVSARP